MRLLDRYLLRELLVPLGFCLAGFLIFWIAFDLFSHLTRLLVELNLRASDIVEYYLVTAPAFLVVAMPMSLLLALLYALTSLSRHHEIVAIRAAGVSLWRLSAPFFLVGLVASLVVFALNEFWVPDSVEQADNIRMRRLTGQSHQGNGYVHRNFAFSNARDGRKWFITVYNQKTAEMTKPLVISTLADGSSRRLYADRAVRTNGAWLFFDVWEYAESSGTQKAPVPILHTNQLLMPQFTESPEVIDSEIEMSARLRDRSVRDADVPVLEILNYLRLHPDPRPRDRAWLYTKLYGRLATPWTCLVVVLIALPFGAASGRRNVFAGVASSIFIYFVFYIFQQVGLALGAAGWVPPWLGGWFPNLAFGSAGVWLTAKVR